MILVLLRMRWQKEVQQLSQEDKEWTPTVENLQDIVENELMLLNYVKTAKSFILYRQKRAENKAVPWRCA